MNYPEATAAIKAAHCDDSDIVLLALAAADLVMPCLIDWIQCTDFGEVNQRDRRALAAIVRMLDAHRLSCSMWGVRVERNETLETARALSKDYLP